MHQAFFQTWKHLPFALRSLSKMWEYATHCCSLPSKACSSRSCSVTPSCLQILTASPRSQLSKMHFIYWMPLAWRTSYPIFQCSAYIFRVGLGLLGAQDSWGMQDKMVHHRFSKWNQHLLSCETLWLFCSYFLLFLQKWNTLMQYT